MTYQRKIAVFTGTRAEYGLLKPLMHAIQTDAACQLEVVISGSHLSPEFGETWQLLAQDGFDTTHKVEMLLSSDTPTGTIKSLGVALLGFADTLARLAPDVLVVLGDRSEALAVAQAALFLRIPIAHLHGGEITQGAYDEAIRHAITKMAYLHFASTETYRQRIIQLGEAPERVWNVGAIGLDYLKDYPLLTFAELAASLENFTLESPFFLVTYHPVTLANEPAQTSTQALLHALNQFPQHQIILTYPNADDGGRAIIPLLEHFAKENKHRVYLCPTLGQARYLSACHYADAVIGNSSSGIIEVPSLGTPTVNIGKRQLGRICADSVIHCEPNQGAIENAIAQAIQYKNQNIPILNPYDQGGASQQILLHLKQAPLSIMKEFYDIR